MTAEKWIAFFNGESEGRSGKGKAVKALLFLTDGRKLHTELRNQKPPLSKIHWSKVACGPTMIYSSDEIISIWAQQEKELLSKPVNMYISVQQIVSVEFIREPLEELTT